MNTNREIAERNPNSSAIELLAFKLEWLGKQVDHHTMEAEEHENKARNHRALAEEQRTEAFAVEKALRILESQLGHED